MLVSEVHQGSMDLFQKKGPNQKCHVPNEVGQTYDPSQEKMSKVFSND